MIQAEATTPIPTGVVFWSHDKGTAKLIIQLKKDHINQTLPQGTIVPILLEFNSDTAANGRGRHIYHAVIEDALEGIVSIVLEDNILGYVGRVDGSVYIELPDSRSLDTAGRFTFDIKRSPIDEDVPELEDYYWQGFNEIIQESKRLIDQVESNCETVLNDLSSKVTSLENQTSDIKSKQAEILKSIEEHDVFTKQESSANVIYQLIGKEKVRITLTLDFKNKIAGSDIENPNAASARSSSTLLNPSSFTLDGNVNYPKLGSLDGETLNVNGNLTTGFQIQMLSKFNILETLKRELGERFFTSQGAESIESQIALIKKILVSSTYHVWGYGSNPNGNKLSVVWWMDSQQYDQGVRANNTNTIREITRTLISASPRTISDDGCSYVLAYADPSDGSTLSRLSIDYSSLDIELEISANDYFTSVIAANHVENLATQDEAETGEDNTKTMTPLRVFQSIAQWTKNKFISLTENETVLGIKNFANGLQVGGNNVLSQNGEIRFVTNSTNNSSLESGSIVFKRYGDDVDIYANFQVRASGDLTRDMNIVAESIVDDIFEPGENFSFFVGSETAQAVVKFVGKGIKAHSTLTKGIWYIGTTSYKAKNKL